MLYSIRHVVSISPMASDRNMFGQKDSPPLPALPAATSPLDGYQTEIIGFHFTAYN